MKKLLKNKAYNLFKDWVNNAKKVYPNLNYDIKDPAKLERDLEDAMEDAIKALTREEKAKKRKIPGYDYGFICGYIQGNLNTTWYNEYIRKQSNTSKMFSAIVALESYLKFDELLKIRLTTLFTEHYKKEINLENVNTSIQIDLAPKLDFLEVENSPNPILVTLENIKLQMIKDTFEEKTPEFLDDVEDSFSMEEIDKILN